MEIGDSIGDRIRFVRKTKRMTQQELADKADISRVTLGFYERNTNIPPSDTLNSIARALDENAHYLLTGERILQISMDANESLHGIVTGHMMITVSVDMLMELKRHLDKAEKLIDELLQSKDKEE